MFRNARALLTCEGIRKKLRSGATVLESGEACRHLVWLARGRIRVLRMSASGREGTLYLLGPEEVCPVTACSVLLDRPSPVRAVVEQDGEAWLVATSTFKRLFASEASVREHVIAAVSTRLVALVELLDTAVFCPLDARLSTYLLERFTATAGSAPAARLRTTHDRIAADLWTSREVVSRLLKQFEQEGFLHTERGRIVLRDVAALKKHSVGDH